MAATVSAATVSAASAMALQRIPPAKGIAREKRKEKKKKNLVILFFIDAKGKVQWKENRRKSTKNEKNERK